MMNWKKYFIASWIVFGIILLANVYAWLFVDFWSDGTNLGAAFAIVLLFAFLFGIFVSYGAYFSLRNSTLLSNIYMTIGWLFVLTIGVYAFFAFVGLIL